MITKFVAIVTWLLLATPAMNLGKAWKSHAVPGPVVSVHFPGGPVEGHIQFRIDGSSWLVDDSGAQLRMNGNEVIASIVPVEADQKSDELALLGSSWRAIAPLYLLTVLALAVFLFPRRPAKGGHTGPI